MEEKEMRVMVTAGEEDREKAGDTNREALAPAGREGGTTYSLDPPSSVPDKNYRIKEGIHAALRLICLVSSAVSIFFMVTAEQDSTINVYGFQLPVSSKWSYSDSFVYLVAVSVAVIAYSLPLLLVGITRLHGSNTPLIPSRRFAWVIFAADQLFAYAMMSSGSAAAGISNLNRTGIHHTPSLPNFCKPLHKFCDRVATSIAFAFFTCTLLAVSSLLDVLLLSSSFS